MTEPGNRDFAIQEPIFPKWAGPVYLKVGIALGLAYLVFDAVIITMPGLAILKALSIVFIAFYAVFSGVPLLGLALLLSAGGDYALGTHPPNIIAGIACFAGAHLVYALIFLRQIFRTGVYRTGFVLAGLLILYASLAWIWLSPSMGDLIIPVTAYFAIILLMAVLGVLIKAPRLVTLGAILFVVSDSMIGLVWFTGFQLKLGPVAIHEVMIWASYLSAQICLAIGIVRLCRQEETQTG